MKLDIQYFASAGIYTTISKEYTYEQEKVLSVKVLVTPTSDGVTAEEFENNYKVTVDGWTKANDGKGSYYKIYTSNTTESVTIVWDLISESIANHLFCDIEINIDEIHNFYNLTICIDKQPMTNPSEELKEISLKLLEPLRSYEDISDQLIVDSSGNTKVIRNVEKYLGSLRLKKEPTEEILNNINIQLFEGDNYIYIKENKTYLMKIQYLINSELNKTFATRLEMNSKFEQTNDSFKLIVSKKLDGNDFTHAQIVAKINDNTSETLIEADKINLKGYVTISDLKGTGKTEINGANITTGTINADRVSGGTLQGTTIKGNAIIGGTINGTTITGGTINGTTITGTTINTDKDLTVGNNIYIGQNQSSSTDVSKKINLTDNSFLQRVKFSNGDLISLFSNYVLYLNATDSGFIRIFNDYISMSHTPSVVSDNRLKQEIKDINVNWIDELKIKEFEYKNTPNKKQIGLMAQDYVDKDYCKYFLNKDENDYYSIAYGNITNALIKYCQNLKNEIEKLNKRIEILESASMKGSEQSG